MPMPTADDELDLLETQLLLEAIYRRYGFDFRDYAVASIRRRIQSVLEEEGLSSLAELQGKLLHNASCMERFLLKVTVHATAMFRDPAFYRTFRESVVPLLAEMPFLRVWHVGCSTGEEVYSMAILLDEAGLASKCRIYATDMNEAVLAEAKQGIFPLAKLQEYTQNYQQAGGTRAFSDYYSARYDRVLFDRHLTAMVVFSPHNLVTDSSFNEFHVVLCRNVMIYFNQSLSARVHRLLFESLADGGFLCLGNRESIRFTPHAGSYCDFDDNARIYRKKPEP
ncbi:MAG: CheR family methyltransferase [Pirellulales bacterium]